HTVVVCDPKGGAVLEITPKTVAVPRPRRAFAPPPITFFYLPTHFAYLTMATVALYGERRRDNAPQSRAWKSPCAMEPAGRSAPGAPGGGCSSLGDGRGGSTSPHPRRTPGSQGKTASRTGWRARHCQCPERRPK